MQVDNNLHTIEDYLSKREQAENQCEFEELTNQLKNVKAAINGPRESQANSLIQIEYRMQQLHTLIQG